MALAVNLGAVMLVTDGGDVVISCVRIYIYLWKFPECLDEPSVLALINQISSIVVHQLNE